MMGFNDTVRTLDECISEGFCTDAGYELGYWGYYELEYGDRIKGQRILKVAVRMENKSIKNGIWSGYKNATILPPYVLERFNKFNKLLKDIKSN